MVLITGPFAVSLLHEIALTCAGQQQQCSVDRLPVFGDRDRGRDSPNHDRFQAIVPAYTFQCSGKVTEWRACVHPSGMDNEQYYIQFQVWRSTGTNGTNGCYDLVGYNTPLDANGSVPSESVIIIDGDGYLLHGRDNAPDRCVVLPVRESQQIEFQPGDVIGYYVDHFRDREDRNDRSGIQWISTDDNDDDAVVVYYRDELPREDIKSQYAISITNINPSVCGFEISTETSDLYSLGTVASSAPIINVSIGK